MSRELCFLILLNPQRSFHNFDSFYTGFFVSYCVQYLKRYTAFCFVPSCNSYVFLLSLSQPSLALLDFWFRPQRELCSSRFRRLTHRSVEPYNLLSLLLTTYTRVKPKKSDYVQLPIYVQFRFWSSNKGELHEGSSTMLSIRFYTRMSKHCHRSSHCSPSKLVGEKKNLTVRVLSQREAYE